MRTSSISISFADEESAKVALAAIAPDNEGFLETSLDCATLKLEFKANSTMGLLRSIDDVLGCLRSIEQES